MHAPHSRVQLLRAVGQLRGCQSSATAGALWPINTSSSFAAQHHMRCSVNGCSEQKYLLPQLLCFLLLLSEGVTLQPGCQLFLVGRALGVAPDPPVLAVGYAVHGHNLQVHMQESHFVTQRALCTYALCTSAAQCSACCAEDSSFGALISHDPLDPATGSPCQYCSTTFKGKLPDREFPQFRCERWLSPATAHPSRTSSQVPTSKLTVLLAPGAV